MTATTNPHHDRRWLILVVLGVAQLMVVLDATIVNIALPSAEADLGFSDGDRQWIITAYALAFGSLLLIGGRLGDLFGRRRLFVTGLAGFAAASALGGFAQSFEVLVASRALQGVFAAMLAPSALSLLTITFSSGPERGKAFGIFGAIAGGGASLGLLLGGILTEYLSWRWCMFVNLFFAIPAAFGALALLTDTRPAHRPKLDIPGVLTASSGLFLLVYGFSRAESDGWTDTLTLVSLGLSAVLLVTFVLIQRRVDEPLLPLRIVTDRNRGGAYLGMGITAIGMFGVFLFLTFYMQRTLRFSPVESGVGFLPMTFAIAISAGLATTRLLPRFGPRPLITGGMLAIAAALVGLAQLQVDSSYAAHVLPAIIVLGLGMGQVFAPVFNTATLNVAERDAGVASAMVNTMQQVGGAVGTALLSTLAATATTDYITTNGGPSPDVIAAAEVHGYTTAFWIAAAIIAAGSVVVGLTIRGGAPQVAAHPAPVAAH
ncbi:MFS transporter [Svornostia abyssi]|uniref:MFS transporter n=1 Tax=Svornostia abyssi TaxID=2898438 RepID=A0ABY5PIW8_9ACTN|nr:MFS transporter [Parviterribacteraceae bacterium J379]